MVEASCVNLRSLPPKEAIVAVVLKDIVIVSIRENELQEVYEVEVVPSICRTIYLA